MVNRARLTALILLTAAGGAAPALAQNALGDGRGLQRDLRVGGDNNFDRGDINAEIRLRNAIVTGNAPGGRSFRGNVGYTSPSEFRGSLGSDSLFEFRRDTIASSFAAQGIRGADAIRYQSAYTTGGVTGLPAGVLRLGPTGIASVPSSSLQQTRQAQPSAWEGVQSLDTAVSTLRSTSVFTAARALTPGVVGVQPGPAGTSREVTASSLMGIRAADPAARLQAERSWIMTSEQYKPGYKPSAGAEGETEEGGEDTTGIRAVNPAGARPASERAVREGEESAATRATVRAAYDDVRERLQGFEPGLARDRKPGEPSRPTDPNDPLDWETRLNELRDRLDRSKPRDEPVRQNERDGATARSIDQINQEGPASGAIDAETLRLIREAGAEVDRFVKGDYSADNLYAFQMDRGQQALAAGRYFDAEERFTRAMGYRLGDVTAQAARVHAQLGAGLFVSSAVNLQALLTDHPEVVGVRFQGSTLPTSARMDQLKRQLSDEIARSAESGRAVPRSTGLLLAYLGFQTGDRTAAQRGLDTLAEVSPPGDPLPRLLRGVWLAADAPPAEK